MKKPLIITSIILLITFCFLLSACSPLSDEKITNDPAGAMSMCSGAPEDKQPDCYSRIAELLGTTNANVSLQACSKINDNNIKVECFMRLSDALLTTNPELAFQACSAMPDIGSIDSSPKGGCVQHIIDSSIDTDVKFSICKQITVLNWKRGCIDKVASEETDPTKIIEICNAVADDEGFRQHCYGTISQSSLTTDMKLSLCDAKSGSDRDNCYWDVSNGLLESNPAKSVEICNKITDINIRNNCLNNFLSSPELVKANSFLAISVCDSSALSTKSRCYTDIARTISGSDPKQAALICQKLSDDVQISDCYRNNWFSFSALVVQNYDFTVSLCNVLTLKKDECLNNAVTAFIDVDRVKAAALCNLMSASSASSCLSQVNR